MASTGLFFLSLTVILFIFMKTNIQARMWKWLVVSVTPGAATSSACPSGTVTSSSRMTWGAAPSASHPRGHFFVSFPKRDGRVGFQYFLFLYGNVTGVALIFSKKPFLRRLETFIHFVRYLSGNDESYSVASIL